MKTLMTRTLTLTTSFGLLAIISACSPAPSQTDTTNQPTPSEPPITETASPSASPTTYRKTPVNPEDKTSEGETVIEAERRFVEYATGTIKTKKSSDQILETGYKLCSFFKDEGALNGVIERIAQDAKNVEEESENLQMSGAAIKTICPEYKDVN